MAKRKLYLGINGFVTFSIINILIANTFITPLTASAAELTIYKAARRMEYKNADVTHTFTVGLGSAPIGKKLAKGDRKTPEGQYFITHKNAKSQFYLSLGISYPNIADANAGLKSGTITNNEYFSIKSSIEKNRLPMQHTKLGGDIFIHGGGAQSDWTWGCIALNNIDMKFLFENMMIGDKVIIHK